MKILIDENVDVRLKLHLSGDSHDVFTVRDMGYIGKKNGLLLGLIREHNFDCWIVVDKNIWYQQNLNKLPCVIVVLDVVRNTLAHLIPLVPQILSLLSGHPKNTVITVTPTQ